MKKISLRVLFFICAAAVFSATGCSAERESRISLSFNDTIYKLHSLTAFSAAGVIDEKLKSPYVYYSFPENFLADVSSQYEGFIPALSVTAAFTKTAEQAVAETTQSEIRISYLYNDDFTIGGKLKKKLAPRSSARADAAAVSAQYDGMRIVFALPQDALSTVRGFMMYSDVPVSIIHAQVTDAFLGWHIENKYFIAGVGPLGGDILSPDFSASDFLSKAGSPYSSSQPPITILLRAISSDFVSPQSSDSTAVVQNRVILEIDCGRTEKVTIRRAPEQRKITLYPILFSGPVKTMRAVQNADMVTGIVMNSSHSTSKRMSVSALDPSEKRFIPLPADPGLILDWPSNCWRSSDFEVFAWEQFPSVLIFDTADYAVQDTFFKRLAFFVEKQGFTGRLAHDSEIANEHGFNAHDYRAESLASFFDKAEKEQFPLHDNELLLKKILLAQNIIIRSEKGIVPGNGAIISISKESPAYLRTTFIVHEGFHGLYFTDSSFRAYNAQVYRETDWGSILFLHAYFQATPTLNYDITDNYLMENEFMAYIMQQPVYAVGPYFAEKLAARRYVNEKYPERAQYIKETNAAAFTDAAKKLESYVFNRWGVAAGRVWLVTKQ